MSYFQLLKAWGNISYEQLKDKMNSSNISLKEEQKSYLDKLNEDGVVVIPNYYSSEKCDTIIEEIKGMIANEKVNKWVDEAKSDTRIFGSHNYSDNIKAFYEDPFLTEIGAAYVKSQLINSHTLGAQLIPQENNLGSGGGWHRDSVYKIQYKSIAYLTDVGPNNGPFEYIIGSHKKSTIYKSILENSFNAHQNRMSEAQIAAFLKSNPNLKSQVFTAKKGSVILVDTSGVHRGMPIQEGERYALTNYFMPKHHYTKSIQEKFEKLF